MNAREVRYLCRVGKSDLVQFGKLLIAAKSCGLVLGKVVTTSSSFYSRVISASKGDVVLELVGKLTTNKEALLKAIDTPSLFSVEAVLASSQDIDVRKILTRFINVSATDNSMPINCNFRMPFVVVDRLHLRARTALYVW